VKGDALLFTMTERGKEREREKRKEYTPGYSLCRKGKGRRKKRGTDGFDSHRSKDEKKKEIIDMGIEKRQRRKECGGRSA